MMKNLRVMALIVGGILISFATNVALAKSDSNAANEKQPTASSAGKASSEQHPKAGVEDIVRGIANTAFIRLDTDKDGRVSHDEFMAPYEKEFNETDANKDGFWTKEEYVDFRVKQMKRMREEHKK
jgi:hypothetical protein